MEATSISELYWDNLRFSTLKYVSLRIVDTYVHSSNIVATIYSWVSYNYISIVCKMLPLAKLSIEIQCAVEEVSATLLLLFCIKSNSLNSCTFIVRVAFLSGIQVVQIFLSIGYYIWRMYS